MVRRVLIIAISIVALAQLALKPASAQTATVPSVLPVKTFTKFDEFGGIQLSPSGEHAAMMTGKYGRSIVAFMSLKERKITGGIRCPDNFEIYDFHWISNRRIVYRLAEREEMQQPTVTGELYAVDLDGKNQNIIYGYRAGQQQTGSNIAARKSSYASARLISPLMGDDKHVLISEMPWKEGVSSWFYDVDAKPLITLLNVYSGDKNRAGTAPLADAAIMVDQQDQVRFAIGRNAQFKYAASWKPDPKGPWQDFDLPGFKEGSIKPKLMSEDAKSVFFIGAEMDSLHSGLFRLDLETQAVTKLDSFEIADVILDLQEKRVIGVVAYTDKSAIHWLDQNDPAARVQRSLQKAFPKQTIHLTSVTKDGHLAVAFVSSDTNPGDYYLFNTETMKADYLQGARKWIDPEQMRPKESFTLKARDGVPLQGYVTRPTGAGPHPMVVLPHGGPHGPRDVWEFDGEAQLLANRGYAVLQVNFRGSGGFGETFEKLGYREWGGKIQDDITDATLWAVDQKIAARDRICIFGASFGGYAALQGAVREPSLYRCAIGYAGIYDLEFMFSSADIPRSKFGKNYLEKVLGTDKDLLRARSPVYSVDKIQVPVLLIHGMEDWRADFDQAKRMKAALEKANKKFEWMALKREGHGAYDEDTRTEVYERILAFLDKQLQPATATTKTP